MSVEEISRNLGKVHARMAAACQRAGRKVEDVRLLLVTKKQPISVIEDAISAGHTDFGENYPEEAAEKLAYFASNTRLNWEMIGHIQSRKAKLVSDGYRLIHSIDSLKLAAKIDRNRESTEAQKILLQVNVAGEANKEGYRIDTLQEKDAFLKDLEAIAELRNLRIVGLMTMPPLQSKASENRRYFAILRDLKTEINQRYGLGLSELSFGTSSDYEVAIEEGATVIRLGEAILGKRDYQKG